VSALLAVVIALAPPQAPAENEPTIGALVELLHSPDAGRRGRAAEMLSERGPKAREAVKALSAALADEDLDVRYWAASALGHIGPEAADAVPALVGALRTSFPGRGLKGPDRYFADARAVCARALGRIGAGARTALPALKEALGDEDRSVHDAAAEAIELIEHPKPGGKP
jgi:HEAT repeat protein